MPLAVSDLVMRVRVGARQLQVLSLLYSHRLQTTAQVHALAFETASRRTCEICLQRLHQKGWVVRAEPLHGGAGGGRRGYVYGLSEAGAEVLTVLAGISRADIPTVAGPEALEPRYVNHQLTVNRCLLAIWQACRGQPGTVLFEWTADPHARVRYRVSRTWRTVHPDAVDELTVDGQPRWTYLEVDRGTVELRRYARFYLSGRWRRAYAQFPEIRIVTAHRPQVQRMLAETEASLRGFRPAEVRQLDAGPGVAVSWEVAVLANPSGAVSVSVRHPAREAPLLVSVVAGGRGPAGHATSQSREGYARCRLSQD